MRKIATLSLLCLASLLALPVAAADKPAAAEKKPSATLEAPLTTGYEAAKPFFRPWIVPTLQRGNAARDAPASRFDGERVWPEAAM